MILFSAQRLAKHFGGLTLFEDVEFALHSGERVGLIGPNGGGKTTLLRILAGETDHEGGLHRRRDLVVARMEQEPTFPEGATVRSALAAATAAWRRLEERLADIHRELEHALPPERDRLLDELDHIHARHEAGGVDDLDRRIAKILHGVGLPPERHDDPVDRLSGGERCRVALARLLLSEPDVWVLDEPTNHLDLDGIAFLERFLARHPAAALVVSHDRRFLDSVTNQTWEIDHARLVRYPGNYSTSRQLREERHRAEWKQWVEQQKLFDKERAFIAKWSAGTRSRQAQSRAKRLARVDPVHRPDASARLAVLNLEVRRRLGDRVLELRDLSVGYPDAAPLATGLRLELVPGEVLGIMGPNGTGKTTLLRTLTGAVAPCAGTFSWGPTAEPAVLEQHETFPDESRSPMDYLADAGLGRDDRDRRDKLGAMLFSGDMAERPVERLSGGERKRLMLTRLILSGHNVLLLDEPTNHLDVRGAEAVTLALSGYPGTVVAISHDRHFLDEVADRVLWLEPGGWRLTTGGFADAEAARLAARTAESTARAAKADGSVSAARGSTFSSGSGGGVGKGGARPYARWSVSKLEGRIGVLESRREAIHGLFADSTVVRDGERMRGLREELAALEGELTLLEEEYVVR